MKVQCFLYIVSVFAILVESAWAVIMLNVLWLGLASIAAHFAH
jgi:hypothetical protein